jgi:predicted nucleic acid-binding protein
VSANASPPDRRVVFDTVVVNYLFAAGEIQLLADLCGDALAIPRSVFDPDETDSGREEVMSELRRGLHLHRRRCEDAGAPPEVRARSEQALPEFERLPELVRTGVLRVEDLLDDELELYAELRDTSSVRRFGLVVGLGPGEAAVLAICAGRGWRPATDDNDAIRVAEQLLPGVKPLRIRALLRLGVERGIVDISRARAIHTKMRELGFWDTGRL